MSIMAAIRAGLVGAALTIHPGLPLAQGRPAGSLCQASETVLFSCRVEARVVAICGNQPWADRTRAAGAVYRYGRPGDVELEVTDLHRAYKGWASGGETQVYADTPTHRYLLFDRMVDGGPDKEGHRPSQMTQGLVVRHGERMLSSRRCTSAAGEEPPGFDQRQVEALLPQGEYVPH